MVVLAALAIARPAAAEGPPAKRTATGRTAKKVAVAGGVGVVSAVTGVALVALTGASRRFVAPLALVSVAGVGLFATSLVSGLYAWTGPETPPGQPLLLAPRFETRLGVTGIHDPVFDHRAIVDQRLDARVAWFRLSASSQFAPESTTRRVRAESAVRLHGPQARDDSPAVDGSFVDVEAAITDHESRSAGFGTFTAETSVRGRWDLARFDDGLRGGFVEGLAGIGLTRDRYATGASDVSDLLLARFAWGLYLGRGGEALLYYDHRRDGFAGGLQPSGIGAGYLGSLGASARYYVFGPFGIGADLQLGAAALGGLSVLYRWEGK
jgi:hypothetical protein